jgi:hypothetical protein
MHKVIPMVKQKNTRIIEVRSHPNRRVQRCRQTVSCFYRFDKSLLKRQRRGQP